MTAMNIVLVVASLLFAGLFFHPRLLMAPLWHATVTPLASIIGSGGFLLQARFSLMLREHWRGSPC